MPPILQLLNEKQPPQIFELTQDTILLGRHPRCAIPIAMDSVSGRHAQLIRQGNRYYIEDLDSKNGTKVNGQDIQGKGRTLLLDQDRIRICGLEFIFRSRSPADASASVVALGSEDQSEVLSTCDALSSSDLNTSLLAEARLRAVLEVTQDLSQILAQDQLFAKILDCLFRIFPQAERALIILRGEEDELVPRAAKYRRQAGGTVHFSTTIVKRAMADRRALLTTDARGDQGVAISQSAMALGLGSVICVPLLALDQTPMGVVQLDTRRGNAQFRPDDLPILISVANQAAIALENAKLHEEILRQERHRARMDLELEIAKEVQAGFLPQSVPALPGYEFWAFYEAAGQVGGDYYDFVALPDGRHAIIVGDVSGKGVPAAIFMARITSETKVALLLSPQDPAAALQVLNRATCTAGATGKFMTMVLCVLDPVRHRLEIASAGHMSPIIRRQSGTLEEPATEEIRGLPIGAAEQSDFRTVETTLEVGDSVVLFSDGITESLNPQGVLYRTERLRRKGKATPLPPLALGSALLADVQAHVAGAEQNDDMTLVVFGRTA